MAIINGYREVPTLALEGDLATTMCQTYESKYSPDQLFYGRAIVRGTQDDEVQHPDGDADEAFMGLLVRDCRYAPELVDASIPGEVPARHELSVAYKGKFWVVAEDAVTEGNAVFFRFADSAAPTATQAIGRFRGDDDAATAALITGARWGSSAAPGELAILELNLP